MPNRPLLLVALALTAASGAVLAPIPAVRAEEWGVELGLRSGFRQDDIRVEGVDAFSGKSVLDLSNTKIHHLELYGRAIVEEGFYYRGSIAVGWYYDGSLFASEDGEDGAPGTFPLGIRPYELVGEVDGEMTFDVTGGIGYQLSLFRDRLQLAPLGGYSFHKNNVATSGTTFSLIDGNILVDGPATGFDTEWRGPWLGFDATGWITPVWSVLVEFEHHWVDVEGVQRLVTPERPAPITGDGTGISWGVATRYQFSRHFALELMYRGHAWDASTARSFDVSWDSTLVTAGLIARF